MLFGSARSNVVAILALVLVLAIISVTATFLRTRDHDRDHLVMDVITYQRQLSHQLALDALVQPPDAAIQPTIDQFQHNMQALKRGGTAVLPCRARGMRPDYLKKSGSV